MDRKVTKKSLLQIYAALTYKKLFCLKQMYTTYLTLNIYDKLAIVLSRKTYYTKVVNFAESPEINRAISGVIFY